jgi:thiol peroxidase
VAPLGSACERRAIFVVDNDNTLKHVEYVKEVAEHPNYDAALNAVRSLIQQGASRSTAP